MQLVKGTIRNSITVEISPDNSATSLQFQFPDIPILRNRKCYGIMGSLNYGFKTGKQNILQVSISTSGGFNPAFLNLMDDKNELFIQNMPLIEAVGYNVIEVNNAVSANNKLGVQPSNGMLLFNPRIVLWNKCYVKLPAPTGLANYCFQFIIFYS